MFQSGYAYMRFLRRLFRSSLYISAALSCVSLAHAQESATLYGPLGLNTVPSARMDETGTVRIGVSTLDPYVHGWLGVQIADPLSVVVRQTSEVSNINDDAERLFPGVDFKLRLLEENAVAPEVSLGVQSAIGHKRLAGEYLALSKRYKDFDFTAGLGWGRFGTAAHFDNPLKIFGSHFDDRSLDGENPNDPSDWFTGEDIGGSFALQKRFRNGAMLEGYVTLTDQSDFDLFGGTTHADHGLRLSLPLGGFKYATQNSKINTTLAPFGRDIGQNIRNPLPLYDLTESFSTRHMAEYWSDITE